jgi:hypothetical protein
MFDWIVFPLAPAGGALTLLVTFEGSCASGFYGLFGFSFTQPIGYSFLNKSNY